MFGYPNGGIDSKPKLVGLRRVPPSYAGFMSECYGLTVGVGKDPDQLLVRFGFLLGFSSCN